MIDFDKLLYAPAFTVLGVPAILVLVGGGSSETFDITVIDKTSGVNTGVAVEVPTILPCAAIRKTDLAALGLSKDDILDGTLTFNNFTWTISNVKPEPNPSGEGKGEVYAMLTNQFELASSES